MDPVVYRRAGPEDKLGVLSIADNIYGGHDYLPSWFDQFIDDVNTTCYLAETSGETVGFCAGLLVDDGQTVIIRAGRVKPTFSNQGIYRKLSTMCMAESTATKHAFAITDDSLAERDSLLKTHTHVVTRKRINMTADRSDLRKSAHQGRKPLEMSDDDLKELLSSADAKQTLFPGDRIIINWVPFRPIPSNVPLFQSVGGNPVVFSDIQVKDGRGLLTTWSSFVNNDTIICTADIYGSDLSVFESHLECFLAHVNSRSWSKLNLSICVNPEVDSNVVAKAVKLNFKRHVMSLMVFSVLEKEKERDCGKGKL